MIYITHPFAPLKETDLRLFTVQKICTDNSFWELIMTCLKALDKCLDPLRMCVYVCACMCVYAHVYVCVCVCGCVCVGVGWWWLCGVGGVCGCVCEQHGGEVRVRLRPQIESLPAAQRDSTKGRL